MTQYNKGVVFFNDMMRITDSQCRPLPSRKCDCKIGLHVMIMMMWNQLVERRQTA